MSASEFLVVLASVFGGSVAALGLVAFLGRSLIAQLLAKELERHKAELSARAEAEITRLKHEFSVSELEHQTRFTRLHERRADVIAAVYQQLDALARYYGFWTTSPLRDQQDPEQEASQALALVRALEEAYYPNAVWLDRATCNALNQLLVEYHTLWRRFSRDVAGKPWEQVKAEWERLARRLRDPIAKQQTRLEDEFRDLLGMTSDGGSATAPVEDPEDGA